MVRITTSLVQIDAVVVDKQGRQVTDLKPEDFRIREDDKEQTITNFSYVRLKSAAPEIAPVAKAEAPKKGAAPAVPTVPPAMIKPEQVRRTIALVADDLGLSFESTNYVRQALRKFVDEQMQAGDLVAILRCSAGSGALQQFTNDKQLLRAAIDRIQWYPLGRSTIGSFTPLGAEPLDALKNRVPDQARSGAGSLVLDTDSDPDFSDFRRDIFAAGTLGAVGYVIRGLRELPGRKSVVLISDGITLFNRVRRSPQSSFSGTDRRGRDTDASPVLEAIKRLTDQANRASVVIYTMDARGLQTLGLTAADNASGSNAGQQVAQALEKRLGDLREDYFRSQDGLNYLAVQTGGVFIHDNNDLAGGIKQIVDDQSGYYLIGYEPDETTFNATGRNKFHRIRVEVKRPGLRVRSRTGFYGISDTEAKAPPRTREAQLMTALTSPFTASGIGLNLTSLFVNEATAGSFMRSLIHINARDLTFTRQPNGDFTTAIDIAETTQDADGTIIDRVGRLYTLRVTADKYETVQREGMVYILNVPVKKPGAYQLRLAVRDDSSTHLGSATQFIEVPDLGKDRLTLSGITMNGAPARPGQQIGLQASAAVRQLKRGLVLEYGYVIYNAKTEGAGKPQLTTQIKLFREGQEVFTGKVNAFAPGEQPDRKRLLAGGSLNLGADLKPGSYILQVIVTDALAKEKRRSASQWINFELAQ